LIVAVIDCSMPWIFRSQGHIRAKHGRHDTEPEQCHVKPQIRLGESDDDPNLKRLTARATEDVDGKTWTKESVEAAGGQWKRYLMEE
jgi:hypothetical protein